ncbi:hypothetical protein XELAEV_18003518mg [Xenopus laevis]|nr:hypothetical protein XELAEV_18003518mg [Xenopus laevis]
MPTCIVKGCSHSCKTKEKFPNVVLHVFPAKVNVIKQWLLNIPHDFGDVDKMAEKILHGKKTDSYRICSEHFLPESYTYQGTKRVLKIDAIPTVFKETPASLSKESPDVISTRKGRKKQKTIAGIDKDICTSSADIISDSSTDINIGSISVNLIDFFHSYSARSLALASKRRTPSQKSTFTPEGNEEELSSFQSSNVPTCTSLSSSKHVFRNPLMLESGTNPDYVANKKSVGISTNPKYFSKHVYTQAAVSQKSKAIQCELEKETAVDSFTTILQMDQEHFKHSTPIKIKHLERSHGTLFNLDQFSLPSSSKQIPIQVSDSYLDDSFNSNTVSDVVTENKYFVFESCLDRLLMSSRCKGALNCTAAIKKLKKKHIGSYLSVDAVCSKGHCFHLWESQPKQGRMPLGNILMSAAILLSGSSYTKVSYMNKILGLKQVGKTTHFRNQRTYLYPTIDFHWHIEQEKTLQQIVNKGVCLSGDGQCDSPGFSAKYCVYTFLEKTTKKFVNFAVDQVSPEFSSVSLEKKNFQKALNELLEKGVNVQLICTDRHPSIKLLMEKKYPAIIHQFDLWHFAKSIGKKISVAIKIHLWWSSRTCEGSAALLKEKWCSLLYHVVDIHKWNSGKMYHQCEHLDLDEDAQKQRLWLKKGSSAHTKLCEIVENQTILKDLRHVSQFCHTGELEVFHSNVLKYRSKRFHFFMDGMVARTQLAAIEHNNNVERCHAHVKVLGKDSAGELRYRMEYSKIKKDWVVKPVYDIKQCNFVFDIMRDVILYVAGEKVFHWESAAEKLPRNIAPIPRPVKAELVKKHMSRFSQ